MLHKKVNALDIILRSSYSGGDDEEGGAGRPLGAVLCGDFVGPCAPSLASQSSQNIIIIIYLYYH